MATLQAPPVRDVTIVKLSRNFAELKWETVGMGFRYEVHVRSAITADGIEAQPFSPIYPNEYTENTSIFLDISENVKYYQWRVRSVFKGFSPGEWAETFIGNSTDINEYNLEHQAEFTPSDYFIENRLELNNTSFLNARNDLQATLCRPGYEFNTNMINADSAAYWFVTNPGFGNNYGPIPKVCTSDARVVPSVIGDVIYAFERWQEVCKVSADGGETWVTYKATNSRLGNPIYDNLCQQAETFSYLLGYDYLIQGVQSTDVDYSHDNATQYSFASVDLIFDQLDYDLGFGFDVERFTNLAVLPPVVKQKADSFGVDNVMTIVTYENHWVWHNNRTPNVFDNVLSEQYGERVFEYTGELDNEPVYDVYTVVKNDVSRPGFDETSAHVIVKKIQYFDDPAIGVDYQDGAFYALVVGEWTYVDGIRSEAHDDNNIRGVYRLSRNPVLDPGTGQIISYDTFDWERVFGETQEQRDLISIYSVISRDEESLIVGLELAKNIGEEGNPVYDNRQVSSGAPGGETHSVLGSHYGTIDDPELVSGNNDVVEAVMYFKKPYFTTYNKPFKQIISTVDGDTWDYKPQDYYGAAYYNWMQRNQSRDLKSWTNEIMYIKSDDTFRRNFTDIPVSSKWYEEQSDGQYALYAPPLSIYGFNGYADGAIIHSANDNKVIGYYKFSHKVNVSADIKWNPASTVMTGELVEYTPVLIEPDVEDPNYILDPHLTPLVYKMAPENYLDADGFFKEFATHYTDFISKSNGSAYNELFNLLNSKDPLSDHYTEYLHKLIYQRNRLLDADKREAVTRFFLSKRADFYSTKGIANSYQFLFKLLYNEDVDLEIESINTFEFFITVESNDVTDDLVGSRIVGANGNADVTYYERVYVDGKRQWRLSLNNLIGGFESGETITSDTLDFTAVALTGVQGDTIDYNSSDFVNRSRSYYVMKIRSEMQLSQYQDDVIRFIHPIGFGFLGITLLTVLINHGISVDHVETIVDAQRSIRLDNGIGDVFPENTSWLDANGNRQYDEFGELLTSPHPLAGLSGLDYVIHDRINLTQGITETQYNDYWSNPLDIMLDESKVRDDVRFTESSTGDPLDEYGGVIRTINPNYNPLAGVRQADENGSMLWSYTPYERRSTLQRTLASGAFSISDYFIDPDETRRLKDNIGNPYDPIEPTSVNIPLPEES